MKADREPFRLGDRHSFVGSRRSDHQARAGEDALTVSATHRLVDLDAQAEVIGGHDQLLHTSIMPLPLNTKTRPRQCTFRPRKLATHTTRPTMSLRGSSHNRRSPSRSPSRVEVTTVVPSRTARVTARTNQPPTSPVSAYRTANGTPRTSHVKKKPTGLATRVFCSQYTWWRHQIEGFGRSTPVTAT